MADTFEPGTRVEWDWGTGTATGEISAVHESDITRTIKGTEVTRKADADCPAYTIHQDDGDEVLKSHTEVRAA